MTSRLFAVFAAMLLMSQSHGALVTDLAINVDGTDLVATFHDFSDDMSFNDLWDANGDGSLSNDGALDPFDFVPYFWNNLAGAEEARDQIIEGLFNCNVPISCPYDWVDESFGSNFSDGFLIPTRHYLSGDLVTLFADIEADIGDTASELVVSRDTPQQHIYAWVTFARDSTGNIPLPPVLLLMLSGAIGLGLMRLRVTA